MTTRRRARGAALEAVGLDAEKFGPRSPFALSGGEARRVAIAGVLAMRPRYLLLDEPTAGLDVRGRGAVLEALERVRAEVGVVVVSHDAEEFLERADRVLVLDGGEQRFLGTPAELLADPRHWSTPAWGFRRSSPLRSSRVRVGAISHGSPPPPPKPPT